MHYISAMKKFLVIALCSLLAFSNCTKETRKWTVQYQLLNLGQEIPTYRVNYQLQNGSMKTVGPISTYNWESEKLNEFEEGMPASLEIEIISGKGHYQLIILRGGAIHEKENMPSGSPSFKIESEI